MTLEGHGQGQEEAPPPPATTRWQGERPEDEDVLLPPYVPGRQPAHADAAEPVESPAAPFAGPESESASSTVEPEPAPAVESSPYDFPWESADEPEPVDVEDLAPSESSEPTPRGDEGVASVTPEEDTFPFEAFDIEGEEQGEREEVGTAPGPLDQVEVGPALAEGAAVENADSAAVADTVERLADVLRREGRSGIERELSSGDRLTAVMAGVLVGYLAGRED